MTSDQSNHQGEQQVILRPAREEDIPAIVELVNGYAAQNLMLPRSPEEVRRTLKTWIVAELDGRVVGCAALARLSPDLAEIRSLAVAADQAGKGIGGRIVQALVDVARREGIKQIAALTLRQSFFERQGFEVVDRWDLSPKIWSECVYCPKFHQCDEIAVAMTLVEEAEDASRTPHRGSLHQWAWTVTPPVKASA